MTDRRSSSHRGADTGDAAPGMPRWVKGLIVAALVVAATLIVVSVLAGGEHGPSLHTSGGDTSAVDTPHVGGPGEADVPWG